jgi:hypothetical protein
MIEALFYGERPIAYGSSLINDTVIPNVYEQVFGAGARRVKL